jgi:formaldehyde-activating enzyme involved in methanogenesis
MPTTQIKKENHMSMTQYNFNDVPLLRADSSVINTNLKTDEPSILCSQLVIPRFNVGNIHEIKKIWGEIQKA